MNTLQWKTPLTKFINKEAFKFTCLHLRRLWHCVVAAIVMVGVSRQGPHGVSIGLIGITFCAAVLPSFINLLKHYRQARGVFWALSLIFVGYVCLCLSDMITTITYGSSARLSQLAWKCLFVILGFVEFYICGRPKRDLINLWQSYLLEYLRKTNRRKWTTGLLSLVRFDALAFIYLHFSRLFFCFFVAHGLLYLCPNPSESIKIALRATALSVAALPSFIHLLKHPFDKNYRHVSAALFFLFPAYIFSCFGGMVELETASSSAHLSATAWQFLFITWGVLEFYICKRPQSHETDTNVLQPLVLDHDEKQELSPELKERRSQVSTALDLILAFVLTVVCITLIFCYLNDSLTPKDGFKLNQVTTPTSSNLSQQTKESRS